jgi:cysteinyl-tRNA synthetase
MDAWHTLQKLTSAETTTADVKELRQKCDDAMNDDLNSPIVIAHLFDACRAINSIAAGTATISADDLKELRDTFSLYCFDILGLREEAASGNAAREEAYAGAVDMLLSERQKAKAAKDWATSDAIRNQLTALGFEIKDGKNGAEWKLNK